MASVSSTAARAASQVALDRIYAVHCQPHNDFVRRVSWYRISILRGDDCVVTTSNVSIELGRRLLTKLADNYGLTQAERAGLFVGALVPFDLHDVDAEGMVR